MSHYRNRIAAVLTVLALMPLQAATVSRQSADAFAAKVARIQRQGADPRASGRTPLTEDEINSWFAYQGQSMLPVGVMQPQISIVGEGKVSGQAVVDLDAVASRRRSSGFDPFSFVGGKVPVTITGTLHTQNGQGRFEVESADVSGVPVPATLLQELLTYYSRTPERPQGLRLDGSFALPASIRQIEVGQGQAVVVQ